LGDIRLRLSYSTLQVQEAILKNQHFVLVLVLAIFALTLAGCSSRSTPEKVYWQYWKACADGEFAAAEEFLTDDARDTARTLGSCAFTHDAINTSEAQKGNPPLTFSQDPNVNIRGEIASITWIDDQGNIANVVLVQINEEWKVTEASWSI
jgi:hypothetical protein